MTGALSPHQAVPRLHAGLANFLNFSQFSPTFLNFPQFSPTFLGRPLFSTFLIFLNFSSPRPYLAYMQAWQQYHWLVKSLTVQCRNFQMASVSPPPLSSLHPLNCKLCSILLSETHSCPLFQKNVHFRGYNSSLKKIALSISETVTLRAKITKL